MGGKFHHILVWKNILGKKISGSGSSLKKDFSDRTRSQKFFQGPFPPLDRSKKISGVGPVWRGLRGGSARTDRLHHRGFPHSAARARATCLPLPAGPAPMFPSAALPRASSLSPAPALPLEDLGWNPPSYTTVARFIFYKVFQGVRKETNTHARMNCTLHALEVGEF